MVSMTSLEAQNQFGRLIDSSQREPITITRHGRPVAVVMSYEDYANTPKTIPFNIAVLISQNYRLSGHEASVSMQSHLARMSDLAEKEGLTEADVKRLVNE